MRASIGERQDVCSGGGHFFVDEGDADADGTDMSILDLRGCDRCSQLFGQIGTQCTEASAERDDRRSMVEHAFGGLVGVQDARLAVHDDHTNIDCRGCYQVLLRDKILRRRRGSWRRPRRRSHLRKSYP